MSARTEVLLRAAYEILEQCEQSPIVENAMELTAHYDGTTCDGACLLEDIANELGIDRD